MLPSCAPQTDDVTTMPCDYKRSGYYMCSYNYVITADALATCSVVGVTVGASVIVHGMSVCSLIVWFNDCLWYVYVIINYRLLHICLVITDCL